LPAGQFRDRVLVEAGPEGQCLKNGNACGANARKRVVELADRFVVKTRESPARQDQGRRSLGGAKHIPRPSEYIA
jgi:hypothetical protein